jgi:hypothetical protein
MGMNADGYTVDEEGYFEKVNNEGRDTNGKNQYDVIYKKSEYSEATKKDYNNTGDKTGLMVSPQFMEDKETVGYTVKTDIEGNPTSEPIPTDVFEVRTDSEAQKIHIFLDRVTNVEWANNYGENNKGDSRNIIVTSHEESSVKSSKGHRILANAKFNRNFRKDHNHPGDDPTSSPSDRRIAKEDRKRFPGAKHRILVNGEYHDYE